MSGSKAREEARFLKGETGVDGNATETESNPAEVEQAKAKEALYRGRTWLGRECLTWVLFKSNDATPLVVVDGEPVSVLFGGKLTLRAASGEITEMAVKGVNAPYAPLIREAAGRGLLVHSARLTATWQERVYDFTLDAEHFDVRSGKTPELLSEEDDEKLTERLDHIAVLGRIIDAMVQRFMEVRVSAQWKKNTVPALRAWMTEHEPTAPSRRSRRAANGGAERSN
jgi:hypothetical protein